MEILNKIDIGILEFVQKLHNPFLDNIFIFMTKLGNVGLVWIIITLALILSKNKKYRNIGITCAISLIISLVLGEGILKHLIRRGRPFETLTTIHLIIPKPLSYSFPSGHSMSSFAAAGVLTSRLNKYKTTIWILALLIVFSRVYLGVHYPSDVIAGMILGFMCARIALKIRNVQEV